MSTKKLEQEVAAFNRRFSVGDPVIFYETKDDMERTGKFQSLTVASPAYVMSEHTAVVHLNGKSGCVRCSHCFMPPGLNA